MKLLVFGCTGQVAREICQLAKPGLEVVALGRDQADLGDPAACAAAIAATNADAVINAAAYTAVDRAEQEEALAHTINAEAPGSRPPGGRAAGLVGRTGTRAAGGTVFGYQVIDPERYGVVAFDADGRAISIEEKPDHPKSDYAVTGLYFLDGRAPARARQVKPSPRGELEITDLLGQYLAEGSLSVELMGRGFAWLDTGTHDSLIEAGEFVRVLEKRQGLKAGCPGEIAYRMGFIDQDQLLRLAEPLMKTGYGQYLAKLVE